MRHPRRDVLGTGNRGSSLGSGITRWINPLFPLHYTLRPQYHSARLPKMSGQPQGKKRFAMVYPVSSFPRANKFFPSSSTREKEPCSRQVPREEGPWDWYVHPIHVLTRVANQFQKFLGLSGQQNRCSHPPPAIFQPHLVFHHPPTSWLDRVFHHPRICRRKLVFHHSLICRCRQVFNHSPTSWCNRVFHHPPISWHSSFPPCPNFNELSSVESPNCNIGGEGLIFLAFPNFLTIFWLIKY